MTTQLLAFLGDKIVPLALIAGGVVTYALVDKELGGGLVGAGLLAYQHKAQNGPLA